MDSTMSGRIIREFPPLDPPFGEQDEVLFQSVIADFEREQPPERPIRDYLRRVVAAAVAMAAVSSLLAPALGSPGTDERPQTGTTVFTPDQQLPASPTPAVLPDPRP